GGRRERRIFRKGAYWPSQCRVRHPYGGTIRQGPPASPDASTTSFGIDHCSRHAARPEHPPLSPHEPPANKQQHSNPESTQIEHAPHAVGRAIAPSGGIAKMRPAKLPWQFAGIGADNLTAD